jgi:glycosyltransferase involved in cell wall biosynthesis
MFNIIHVVNSFDFRGTSKAAEVIINNSSREFRHTVLVTGQLGQRADRVSSSDVDVIPCKDEYDLKNTLRNYDYDVIHLHGDYFDSAVLREIKSVSNTYILVSGNFGWPNRSNLFDIADEYIFNSWFTLYRFSKLNRVRSDMLKNTELDMIYLPLNSTDFNSGDSGKFRSDLGIGEDVQLIGKIGPKWSSTFVKALRRVDNGDLDVKFVFVDPSDNLLKYLSKIGLSKNSIILDRIPGEQTSLFYNSIDVLAHSSHIGESFGNVFTEAMAQSTPVVTNSMPMRDNAQIEIVDHGVTGYIANSTQSFADALLDLLSNRNKLEAFGRAGERKAKREFNPDKIVREWECKYRRNPEQSIRSVSDLGRVYTDYESEYNARLSKSYGEDSLSYRLEKHAWLAISNLPTHRRYVYNMVRYRKLDPEGGAPGGLLSRGLEMLRKRV